MGATTKINWCDATFNPWIGCTKIAPGCQNCYAAADMDNRRKRVMWGPNGTRSRTSNDYWKQPHAWNRQAEKEGVRKRVFCASLADVFEEWDGPIQDAQKRQLFTINGGEYFTEGEYPECRAATMSDLRRDLFATIDACPMLDFLLLTKRPQNVRKMWVHKRGCACGKCNTGYMPKSEAGWQSVQNRGNVHLLASVSDQATAEAMIPPLLECRDLVPVLGVSAEPLIEEVRFGMAGAWYWKNSCVCGSPIANTSYEPMRVPCDKCGKKISATCHRWIDWVIVGAESGPGRRPMRQEWAESAVDQCRAAGVACWVKQIEVDGEVTDDVRRFPVGLRVRERP